MCHARQDGSPSRAIDPGLLETEAAAARATILWTVPALLRPLAERSQPPAADLALRIVRTGTAPLPHDVARGVRRRYGVTIVQQYGSSEAGQMIGTPAGGAPAGSIGTPYPGVAARIVDADGADLPDGQVGELVVRSPGLMRGYLGDPEATADALRDGWLWTGDLARRDADGFYYLAGRRALRINVGGFKVAPEEVEAVLEAHPAIREAAVVASADAARGEVVKAVIVARGERPGVWGAAAVVPGAAGGVQGAAGVGVPGGAAALAAGQGAAPPAVSGRAGHRSDHATGGAASQNSAKAGSQLAGARRMHSVRAAATASRVGGIASPIQTRHPDRCGTTTQGTIGLPECRPNQAGPRGIATARPSTAAVCPACGPAVGPKTSAVMTRYPPASRNRSPLRPASRGAKIRPSKILHRRRAICR